MPDQQHPQAKSDHQIIAQILQAEATPDNQAEVARLLIRYQDFPGAREIQKDLAKILEQWGLTKEILFAQTRKLYLEGKIGFRNLAVEETQDWS